MTRKQKRLTLLSTGLAALALATGLVLYALNDTIIYFYTPAKVAELKVGPNQPFRLGGIVEKGSIERGHGLEVRFKVADAKGTIPVFYYRPASRPVRRGPGRGRHRPSQ